MKSWKTTVLGLIALIVAACTAGGAMLDDDPETNPNWDVVVESAIGLGLLFARDNNVTSEESGAKEAEKKKRISNGLVLPILAFALIPVLSGCVSLDSSAVTDYTERVETRDPDTGEVFVNEWSAHAKTRAGIFGTVPEGVHEIAMESIDGDTTLMLGQKASIDNSTQIEGITVMTEMVSTIMQGVTNGIFNFLSANPGVLTPTAPVAPTP